MNLGILRPVSPNPGRSASPQAPREYRKASLGLMDDFTMSLKQHEWAKKSDRSTATRILLVEDDDDLRNVMEVYLDMMGYRVIPCCDGQVAFALFHSNVPFDALISDLEMPGKSGLELAREVTATRPSLPVMIISGALISSDMALEMESRNWKFLPKPCGLPLILTTLQSLLSTNVCQAA